jgi:hypothetical protein
MHLLYLQQLFEGIMPQASLYGQGGPLNFSDRDLQSDLNVIIAEKSQGSA